jgi:hypothetical protein
MKVKKIAVVLAILILFGTCAYAADCNNGGRYEINGTNGTVTDCRTGLIWLRNAKCVDASNGITPPPTGNLTWYDAMKWAAGLQNGKCGLSDGSAAGDWRLPTKTEWVVMMQGAVNQNILNPALTDGAGIAQWTEGNVFNNVLTNKYWSSTTYPFGADTAAWYAHMGGYMVFYGKVGTIVGVWPVRAGRTGSFGTLRIE